jgi:hypothetical protein
VSRDWDGLALEASDGRQRGDRRVEETLGRAADGAAEFLALQRAIGNNAICRALAASRPIGGRVPGPTIQRGEMGDDEKQLLRIWLREEAAEWLATNAPGLVTDARPSRAIRLRWFGVVIGQATYKIGLNIHYGGDSGGLWIVNERTTDSFDAHPGRPPRHGLNALIETQMVERVRRWDERKGTHYADKLRAAESETEESESEEETRRSRRTRSRSPLRRSGGAGGASS